jgi:hypothetical protein
MSDTLSETEGCSLLAELFRARGFSIQRNVLFREYGVTFHVDGWDPHARVGFEFLTSEDEDHDDLSLEEYKTLNDHQQRGELSLFIIDEVEPISASALLAEANEFLDEVNDAAQARRLAAVRQAKAQLARSAVAAKSAGKQMPAGKHSPAAGKTVTRPTAAPKRAGGKRAAGKPARPKPARPKSATTKPVGKSAARKPAAKPAAKKPVAKKLTLTKPTAKKAAPKKLPAVKKTGGKPSRRPRGK